jgi:hypothetical protein
MYCIIVVHRFFFNIHMLAHVFHSTYVVTHFQSLFIGWFTVCIIKRDENVTLLQEVNDNKKRGKVIEIYVYIHFRLISLFLSNNKHDKKVELCQQNKPLPL